MTNFDEEKSPEEQNMPEETSDEQVVENIETIKLETDDPVDVHITVEDDESTPKTSSEYKDENEREIAFRRKNSIENKEEGEEEEEGEGEESLPEDNPDYIPEEAYEKKDKNYKKYVVRIHKEYTDFLDNISLEERNKIFNKCIKDVIANQASEKAKRIVQEAIRHIIIIIITIIIGIPLTFHVVNFSIKSTLKSYKYMQVNFEKLYQQKQLDKF